ncbi:ATP-grasp domain-containing protein [Pelagicoccus sp. NFK12]|uniref:ATP-grasp domain-containing protein n=1 Tax=Pelagicoccus enzymogenes TaxID=2773457 RepID=A0A927IIW4_9BACT|nr:ATP-grasp domain-containing protein [Pelagicoccus enzymogenes]MBD5781681.1 ATP-grasp domain-containing protein [Pelagicoccus enzymogenes]MDQ8200039.1 ATP-grasp domain-containing protein [Pelagicoccus enzymogenes]
MKLLLKLQNAIKEMMLDSRSKQRNLLLLSGGSKVAIARIAKKAARKRGIELHISDTSPQVPTSAIADHFTTLPSHTSSGWIEALLQFCEGAKIGLIIPSRHSELTVLEQARPQLRKIGTQVAISDASTLKTCIHKLDTYRFLKNHGIPTPRTCLKNEYDQQFPFPIVAKPERGFSSSGAQTIESAEGLDHVPPEWILQEKATGIEHTVNLYLSKSGEVRCCIPHERLAVEAGEVVQAQTRRHASLIKTCQEIAHKLPGARGIINIQGFVDPASDTLKVIEINPRIGGGYPLCDAAKGHYIEWLCREYLDGEEIAPFDQWTENLLMMRYRDALFSL